MADERVIIQFSGAWAPLSNFYAARMELGGLIYPTAEHAFQAQKTDDPTGRYRIRQCATPSDAKRLGRTVELRHNWDRDRKRVMHQVLLAKFTTNPDLAPVLLGTGDAVLVEGNVWHDNYWGDCHCAACFGRGLNYLGRLLMSVRLILRED